MQARSEGDRKRAMSGAWAKMLMLSWVIFGWESAGAEEAIDASDPTRIYSYAGAGMKYTDYTNDESMTEMRVTGNLGITEQDMIMFEGGYGWHSGDKVRGDNSGLTNARARWFHLVKMDYGVSNGYRGWATQVDLQVAGELKGTDGQNVLAVGVLPAFGLGSNWSFYLALNAVNVWDKNFENWNGMGIGAAPLLVYVPDGWWPGAYVQLWPNYISFFAGDLSGKGSGNIDGIIGGEITPEWFWSVVYQKNVDKDLNAYNRGSNTGLVNDQNLFVNVTVYF